MTVANKVIIITGASAGIGAAAARELAARGATVVLAARRQTEIDALAAEITARGGKALAVATDVSKVEDIERLVTTTLRLLGRIDVLFNNAGVGDDQPVGVVDDAALARLMDINLFGPIRVTRAVLPHMRTRRSGHIITTGSVASFIATPGIYSVSKFGVRAMTDALRRELRGDGIHVSLLAPGFIRTDMTAGLKIPMPGPALVARVLVGLIERPRRLAVVPGFYRPLIWLAELWPWFADIIMSRIDLSDQAGK